jgi:tRNA A-37 threonylcarbamoyl transferase component Bud32
MQKASSPEISEGQKEQELESMLKSLPQELSETWRRKVEELDSFDEGIALVRNFNLERSSVKEKIFTKIHTIHNEQVKEEVRELIRNIGSNFGNPDNFLGEGTVGKVYRTSYAPHVCVKYITESNMLEKHGNTMHQEIQYLDDLDNFSVEGIRVPQVYFEHMSDHITCFGMETIDGKSIDQIIARPDDCDFIEEIKKQDMKEVLRRMKLFIERMHEEIKIVHRDFATRNIMVDRQGNWYVIDFGKAKRIEIGDTSTDMSQATDFPSAENAIRKLFAVIY